MSKYPRGSIENAMEEARNRSKMYAMTCYVFRVPVLEEDEKGVYGYYCYDSGKPEDGYILQAVYKAGLLVRS